MSKKLALIMSEGRNLITYPSIVNSISILSEHKYDLDVFLPISAKPNHFNSKVNFMTYVMTYVGRFALLRSLYHHTRIRKYTCFIAYHVDAFIIASLVGIIQQAPVIYHNLEILGYDRLTTIKLRIKKILEIFFNKRAIITVTQDKNRLKLLSEANRIASHKIITIPNTYTKTYRNESNYLRVKFNIKEDRIIILYVGGIEAWALDEKLLDSVKGWPENFVLVMHGWSRDGYIRKLKPIIRQNRERIYVDNEILEEEEYSELVSSGDVCLAWYKSDSPKNVHYVGLSSGRFAQYLRCGLPIVAPKYLPDFKRILSTNKIGELAKDEYDIKNAAEKILKNYSYYRNNTFRYFENYLDFRLYFRNILDILEQIPTSKTH